MKTIFEYDKETGAITDKNGLVSYFSGMEGFDKGSEGIPVLELIKLGVTPDEIIKLKNNNLFHEPNI